MFIRILISILSLTVFLNGVVVLKTAAASNGETDAARSFSIRIQSDDETDTDLSGIVFHVYEATLAFSDDSGMSKFDETFVFDVFSSENGEVTFERPSDCFSVTIDLDSLPDEFGADKQTEFYLPYVKSARFNVNKIYRVVSNADCFDNLDEFTVYDKNDGRLYVSVDSHVSIDVNEFYSSILNDDEINASLRLTEGPFEKNVNTRVDISEKNAFQRIDFLFDKGLISAEERIELYCDAFMDCRFEGVYCLHAYKAEIAQYASEHSIASERLRKKIARLFDNSVLSGGSARAVTSYSGPYASANINVYYSPNISTAEVMAVSSFFESLRTTYINYGFLPPLLEPSFCI